MNDVPMGELPLQAAELAGAAYFADLLFGGFRWSFPAAPRWAVMLALLVSSELASFLMLPLQSHPWDASHIAGHVLVGLAAAGAVWTRRRVDLAADRKANGTAPATELPGLSREP